MDIWSEQVKKEKIELHLNYITEFLTEKYKNFSIKMEDMHKSHVKGKDIKCQLEGNNKEKYIECKTDFSGYDNSVLLEIISNVPADKSSNFRGRYRENDKKEVLKKIKELSKVEKYKSLFFLNFSSNDNYSYVHFCPKNKKIKKIYFLKMKKFQDYVRANYEKWDICVASTFFSGGYQTYSFCFKILYDDFKDFLEFER